MPFDIALSGLNAASTDLEVTGNNIANAATTGFKESRAEFADVYSNSLSDTSSNANGRGVRVARVAQQFDQGTVDFTGNNLDVSINGEGFFVLKDQAGSTSYTRAGAYSTDRNGLIVNHANQRLQGYPATQLADGSTSFATGSLTEITLPLTPSTPTPTSLVNSGLNLDAREIEPGIAFDPTLPDTYNHSTSTTVYDSLGISHTLTKYYVTQSPTTPGSWDVFTEIDGTSLPVGGAASTTIAFDSTGALVTPAAPGTVSYDLFPIAGSAAADLDIDIDFTNMTQFGANFAVNGLTQNGFTSGRLSGVEINDQGVVFARFTNGQSEPLAKLALAKFNNTQGLRPLGDTNWAESFESGDVQLGEAGTSSFGLFQSGALEGSNVDVAEQLVNMITAQRNFQANAQVITTADSITQTVINIR